MGRGLPGRRYAKGKIHLRQAVSGRGQWHSLSIWNAICSRKLSSHLLYAEIEKEKGVKTSRMRSDVLTDVNQIFLYRKGPLEGRMKANNQNLIVAI